jgi:glutathione synthase
MIGRILVLVSERGQMAMGNHLLYPNALIRRGVDVGLGDINSIHARHYVVKANVAAISEPLSPGVRLDSYPLASVPISDFDLVWVMSPPHPSLAVDVYQLLWLAQTRTPFVNSIEAIVLVNNKNILGALAPPENLVPTNVDSRYEDLWNIFDASDHDWVVKPSNFFGGGDVFRVRKGDSNARALLQSATGNPQVHAAMMESSILGLQRQFCVLQRFEPRVQKNEKRVLIAGGKILAHYLKVPAVDDHRGNLVNGGKAVICELSSDEHELCAMLGNTLVRHGIRFAGIDLVHPYILEVNILNPAGARSMLEISDKDISDRGVDLILKYFEESGGSAAVFRS